MKINLYLLLSMLASALCFTPAAIAQNTHLYVSAHPDDWQLFMNPNAYKSIKSTNDKVVFIHITAGDVGCGTGNTYYLAREEGSLRAIRFMVNTTVAGEGLGPNMSKTTATVNGHKLLKYTYRNAVAYFLRLPDGGDGNGYPVHGYASLEKLYKGTINSIAAIDGSTNYSSLSDLKSTIKAIVDTEAATSPKVFNLPDTDISLNPYDHSDHIHSSLIVQSIASVMSGVTMNLYVEYYSDSKPQNLVEDDYLINIGTWGATVSGITDNMYPNAWDKGHNTWASRQYFRTILPSDNSNTSKNIALLKPTSCSGSEGGPLRAGNAVDGNYTLSNFWAASPYAQWWQVDLGDRYDLSKVAVFTYYDGSRYYQYDIQASLDGVTWTRVVDFSANKAPATSAGNAFPLAGVTARYLRVNMSYNSANTGVHIVEFEAYGELSATTADPNVALFKPTKTSAQEGARAGSFAVDKNYSLDNFWAASPYAQWWQVDLGDRYDLSKVAVFTYYDGSRYYQYDIQASLDGVTWTRVVDFSANKAPATSAGNAFPLAGVTARYLRVNMSYNSANTGVHIVEFEAYGKPAAVTISGSPSKLSGTLEQNVVGGAAEYNLQVYPNPYKQGSSIKLAVEMPQAEQAQVELVDMNGKRILKQEIKLKAGANTVELPSEKMAIGMHLLKLHINGQVITRKVYLE